MRRVRRPTLVAILAVVTAIVWLAAAPFFPEQAWHSRAGAALYNQRDKEKARRLLKEAGYQGQPVRWLVTTEYEHHYKPALVGKSQLEEIGFKVDLQVADWATVDHLLRGRRAHPGG